MVTRLKRPTGLARRPEGASISRVVRLVRTVLGNLEELAMVSIFVVFVYYGVQWLMLIFT